MKTKKLLRVLFTTGMVLTAIFILKGCAPKKNVWGDTKKGLILSYRMPDSHSLRYVSTGDVTQNMEMMGQKFQVTLKSYQVYSIKTEKPGSQPMTLDITIDTMHLYLKTPMNEFSPDMGEVIGRSFAIKLTALGKESDFAQAEAITFNLGGETRNLGPEFQSIFPDFPKTPVKPGDSWSYPDTIREEAQGNWLHLYVSCTATLEGVETLNGIECAKVTVPFTGTVLGEGNMQGISTKTTGEISGTDTYYFDYKKGILVTVKSEGVVYTTTKTSGARELTIPATRKFLKEMTLSD